MTHGGNGTAMTENPLYGAIVVHSVAREGKQIKALSQGKDGREETRAEPMGCMAVLGILRLARASKLLGRRAVLLSARKITTPFQTI